jgi:hypothetical protein
VVANKHDVRRVCPGLSVNAQRQMRSEPERKAGSYQ